MDQGNTATPDELQQAINSITNGGAQNDVADAVAQVENSVLGAVPAYGNSINESAVWGSGSR